MNFSVDLDNFRGPLDLLLYLVRKHEVEVVDIPVSLITDQYLAHLEVLEDLDVNTVGDFIEIATMLMEIKSRMVLPRADEVEEELEDPRQDLVRRLLEYKQYKDAASMLDERGRDWQQRWSRLANDLPPRQMDLSDQPIHEVELWDLVSAFGRVVREQARNKPSNIVYDDTPIHVFMERIHERLNAEGRLSFSDLFTSRMHKSTLVGHFLAILELVRHHKVRCDQNELFSEIWVLPGTEFESKLEASEADNYEHGAAD